MGTRADWYVGRGAEAEWIGSTSFDGMPEGLPSEDPDLLKVTTESGWRKRVELMLARQRDGSATRPEEGWPWPWETSATTDYSYSFDAGQVWISDGRMWWPAGDDNLVRDSTDVEFGEPDELPKDGESLADGIIYPASAEAVTGWPDMSARRNDAIVMAKSGLIVFGG